MSETIEHIFDKWRDSYVPPLPCVRDENGGIKEQKVKQLFAKINEELDELKEIVFYECSGDDVLYHLREDADLRAAIAEEAADTITAITTLCYYLGLDYDERNEAQLRVNEKNRQRGRL